MISLNYFLHYNWIIWYLIWKSVPLCWFFHFFLRLTPRKNWLGQKFKIPKTYVFWYNNSAHFPQFWWWLYENPRRSSRKCAKYANFEHSADPCDLDLGWTTKTILPGSYFYQYQYILNVSRKSDNGKGVKRVWRTDGWTDGRTDGQTDKSIPISVKWQIKNKKYPRNCRWNSTNLTHTIA